MTGLENTRPRSPLLGLRGLRGLLRRWSVLLGLVGFAKQSLGDIGRSDCLDTKPLTGCDWCGQQFRFSQGLNHTVSRDERSLGL